MTDDGRGLAADPSAGGHGPRRADTSLHVLRAEHVGKRFKKVVALDDVSLAFGPGTTALLGRNGAGKSTLVRILVGVEEPTSGRAVLLAGESPVTGRDRMRHLGWLPQSFGFPSGMRVVDFLRYAAWLKEVPRSRLPEAVDRALAVSDIADVAHRRMRELSGGTVRRVGMAAAVVHEPSVLVLDEPTTGLDPLQRAEFHATIKAYAASATVVLATHILEDVQVTADLVHVLDRGRALWTGGVSALAGLSGSAGDDVEALRGGLLSLVGPART